MGAAIQTPATTALSTELPARVRWRTLSGKCASHVTSKRPMQNFVFSDFGFERVHLNSPCTPIPGYEWPPPQPDLCPEGFSYNITSG